MILVTGGTGFLGAELIKQLTDQGLTVRALRREKSKIPDLIKDNALIEWFMADINEPSTLEEAFSGVTQVYHCAAFVSLNSKHKKQLFHVNIDGTSNIVNLCIENNCRLLHVSSIAALGIAKKGKQISERDFWEYDSKAHAYGLSKYEGEMEVWRGINEGLNGVIVNPSIIMGKSAGFEGSGAIFKLVKEGLPFYTNGASGFVDVEDVAQSMILLMAAEVTGERFIISSGNMHYQDLFTQIAQGFAVNAPTREAKPWMLGLAWRALKLVSVFTRKEPSITKDTATSSVTLSYYDNTKVIEQTGIHFKPVNQIITEITQYLK
ncbi:nucleoside-diphosphate-sugar epimerase [Pedobacter psychrotolerans]|uniref:NAD-dependent epimerase n=1 Tax=Pedobacter psychrotolerans TaxID=1843235 RepID=A0A4R2H2W7_9SPHI|nr:NAD-dependent epimerase/dehydratase family protein [Pedobacter psychrotolerans]TCO19318.1 nucleoside-diphosphate-sugar epimerase [Pedobacter psychrotolerans]GGE69600.1 NAD-dependent epimerase [Pedobacter psychrotolerans]